MSALWTRTEAEAATGGTSPVDWAATSVSIDTRTLEQGALFVALKDVRDGHDFVATALQGGAAAALVSRIPDGVAADAPLLLVPDVLEALGALGAAARKRTQAQVIGVTGSVGKTSTKEMLRVILGQQGKVHAAEKSYNNHWGVPLTLARMPADSDFAVIEIGMNHPGEIAPLARLADPDVAMVTIVAPAHLEAFGVIEGIAHEKASIFKGLRKGGVAVLNGDLETTPILRAAAAAAGARIMDFGQTAGGGYARLRDVLLAQGQTVAHAMIDGQDVMFKLASAGTHFAMNGLAALCAAQAAGADLGRAVPDLSRWRPVDGRGVSEVVVLDDAEEGISFQLLDDAYNANPASVGAALEMLCATDPAPKGRRIAILGDMLELGPSEARLHADLASHPALGAVACVHCVGPRMRALWEALPPERQGRWAESADALLPELGGLVRAGDVVLVKGSLGIRLARVVDGLRKLGQSARTIKM